MNRMRIALHAMGVGSTSSALRACCELSSGLDMVERLGCVLRARRGCLREGSSPVGPNCPSFGACLKDLDAMGDRGFVRAVLMRVGHEFHVAGPDDVMGQVAASWHDGDCRQDWDHMLVVVCWACWALGANIMHTDALRAYGGWVTLARFLVQGRPWLQRLFLSGRCVAPGGCSFILDASRFVHEHLRADSQAPKMLAACWMDALEDAGQSGNTRWANWYFGVAVYVTTAFDLAWACERLRRIAHMWNPFDVLRSDVASALLRGSCEETSLDVAVVCWQLAMDFNLVEFHNENWALFASRPGMPQTMVAFFLRGYLRHFSRYSSFLSAELSQSCVGMIHACEDWNADDVHFVLAHARKKELCGHQHPAALRTRSDTAAWVRLLVRGVFGDGPCSFAQAQSRGTASSLLDVYCFAPSLVWQSPATVAVLDTEVQQAQGLGMRSQLVHTQLTMLVRKASAYVCPKFGTEVVEAAKRSCWRLLTCEDVYATDFRAGEYSELLANLAKWRLNRFDIMRDGDVWSDDEDGVHVGAYWARQGADEVALCVEIFRCCSGRAVQNLTIHVAEGFGHGSFLRGNQSIWLRPDTYELDVYELAWHLQHRNPHFRYCFLAEEPWTEVRASWIAAVVTAGLRQ